DEHAIDDGEVVMVDLVDRVFFFQAEDGIRGLIVTGVQTCALPIFFVDRTDVEELGVKYDLGSQNQFFNRLVQRPDPCSAKPVDTDLDGVPDALVPTENFPPNQNIVALGGNSLSDLGNANQAGHNPALELLFSTAIGKFDLT